MTTTELDKDLARAQAEYNEANKSLPEIFVILCDEGTGEEYRVAVAKLQVTVWSTINDEFGERNRYATESTYGGREISETQTWEQLGVSDDATVIVATQEL